MAGIKGRIAGYSHTNIDWGQWLIIFTLSYVDIYASWLLTRYMDGTVYPDPIIQALGIILFVFASGMVRWSLYWRTAIPAYWTRLALAMFLFSCVGFLLVIYAALTLGPPVATAEMSINYALVYLTSILAGGLFGGASGAILFMAFSLIANRGK